jgi:hypothetical protein
MSLNQELSETGLLEADKYNLVRNSTKRIIGKHEGRYPGPNLLFFAGVHGNEPAGILALRMVLHQIKKDHIPVRGKVYAVAGNIRAIRKGVRFIDRDLNRIWYPGFLVDRNERQKGGEYHEKIDLLQHVLTIIRNNPGHATFLLDLHTTSSQSIPFISISDTLKNRRIIRNIPVPLVLGLEELLDGPMFSFFSELGLSTVLFEGGQHDAISSLENHVAFIWLMLHALGCCKKRTIPSFHTHQEILKKNSLNERKIFEIKHRHLIEEGEAFKMKEGYANFQHIKKGEILAKNQHRDIKAPMSGRIFMPLYQKLGRDGFFVVREIRPLWIRLSGRTRKWKLEHLLRAIPGITREKNGRDAFKLDNEMSKLGLLSFFHLLGYRKVQDNGHSITLMRRPYDRRFPKSASVIRNIEAYIKKITE